MGAVAVFTMTENAHATDSGTPRPVHPFFAQNRACTSASTAPTQSCAQTSDGTAVLPPNISTETKTGHDSALQNTDSGHSRRRKADQEPKEEDSQKRARPSKRSKNTTNGGDIGHLFLKMSNGVDGEKQLRQGNSVANPSGQAGASHETNNVTPDECQGRTNNPVMESPRIADSSGALVTDCAPGPTGAMREANTPIRPRKMLQFNPKTGTIGSPPKPKESRGDAKEAREIEKLAGRRGRKPASRIVRILYGTDSNGRTNLGNLIESILGGETRHLSTASKTASSLSVKRELPKAGDETPTAKPSKATHPFFLGQTKPTNPAATDPKPKKPSSSSNMIHYCSTPCSPRKSRAVSASKIPMLQFGVKNLGLKFPGAKLPAWPWQGMVHIRGDVDELPGPGDGSMPVHFRKSKGNAINMMPRESVIRILADSMELPLIAESVRTVNTDEFIPPPSELRLPQKHFESGSKLQSRVLPQLKTFQLPTAAETTSMHGNNGSVVAPPQLSRLFSSISTSLSAFDMSQCETANWVQKYAPMNAIEVLQPEREIFFLRDWLRALMVQSVDTGSGEPDKPKTAQKTKSSDASRRKRRKKLDGFIVSSEDEGHEWYDLSEGEDDWAPSGFRGIVRKTVMRSSNRLKGRDNDKTANALVISGPQGCGKTAAVYAVAKELDFEVFEINASSRRSGKDVLEKIGDMTRNHHVQQQHHQQQHSSETPNDEDTTAGDDGVAKEIKSGKQSTMKAFFEAKTKGGKSKPPAKNQTKGSETEVKKEPSKSQRQSLILLEEVDILYEEDKQFWTTLVGLIAQAKRPFIMTCNDETLVPLHTLTLHGIFRLSTPPKDLAVDRLLLIAANEGHALTRESVEQLYDSRGGDLRAATMDLQFWCQIGVGDRKGGLDWFYPRWPRGVDLDENKEVIRVVSQDTYRLGMNLLGRDPLTDSKTAPRLVEEEVLHQTWESWGLDVGHWQDSPEFACWVESLAPDSATPACRLPALEAYDYLASAMSVADVCSSKSFAEFKEEPMDTTQPEQPAKVREDFVLGFTHLDSPVITHYSGLPVSIACTIKSLAKSSLSRHVGTLGQQAAAILHPLDETQAIHYLQKSFTSTAPGTAVIDRMDFAFAFDPIAAPDTSPIQPVSYLEPSVFDRTLKLITLDVAPYVRSIVAYEAYLQKQRAKLSTLVSEGGKAISSSKRMRTTRAALSALEGGSRSTTRAERWFKADINPYLVAKTAGKDWNGFVTKDLEPQNGSTRGSAHGSPPASPDITPTKPLKKADLKSRKRKNLLGDDDEEDDGGDADRLGYLPGDVSG